MNSFRTRARIGIMAATAAAVLAKGYLPTDSQCTVHQVECSESCIPGSDWTGPTRGRAKGNHVGPESLDLPEPRPTSLIFV